MPAGGHQSGPLPETLLAKPRSLASWNERFTHWERPPSDSEEAEIHRCGAMVRNALGTSAWLLIGAAEVRPQGSYHNNTNVRRDSDMDLCGRGPGIQVEVAEGRSAAEVNRRLGYTYTSGRSVPDIAAQLHREVGDALAAAFGSANVRPGNKAFRIPAVAGSRADADVVPAVRFDFVRGRTPVWFAAIEPYERVEGVIIYAQGGTETVSFSQQQHFNGKAKRERTRHRFKKVARTAKWLRDELVALGHLKPGQVPSFLIECLVYGVEDEAFLVGEDRYARMQRILGRIGAQVQSPHWTPAAVEINEVKLLFHHAQPWAVADAQSFEAAVRRRMET